MKIKEVKLLNFGSLKTLKEKKAPNKNSSTGYYLYPAGVQFVERTDKLKCFLGLKFGIEYFIQGIDNLKKDEVKFCCNITHPQLVNPETNLQFAETNEIKINYLNETNFDYFSFEYEWEIKIGIWTFQIIENDRILLETPFKIY